MGALLSTKFPIRPWYAISIRVDLSVVIMVLWDPALYQPVTSP